MDRNQDMSVWRVAWQQEGDADQEQGEVQADAASQFYPFYLDKLVWVHGLLHCFLPPKPSGDLTLPSPALVVFQPQSWLCFHWLPGSHLHVTEHAEFYLCLPSLNPTGSPCGTEDTHSAAEAEGMAVWSCRSSDSPTPLSRWEKCSLRHSRMIQEYLSLFLQQRSPFYHCTSLSPLYLLIVFFFSLLSLSFSSHLSLTTWGSQLG